MKKRLNDFLDFVNSVLSEHSEIYNWKTVDENYLLNGLVDKWKYSFTIMDREDRLCFVNFSSVYGDIIHNHCTFAAKSSRGKNFAKLHMIKLCQTGLDNGFTHQEGYWPKNNNRSIILFLKMGWEIKLIRDNVELMMTADLLKVRNMTYELYLSEK
ncbi:MAG: hypothetical protein N2510_01790 [Ignavibacteria bacterium]|nr:hypothetical protein [Ignavibacteria bacterium]